MLNLDTNIIIFILDGRLKPDEKRLIEENPLGVSSIVLWELAKLKQLGRIAYGPEDEPMAELLESLLVWAIDVPIAVTSTRLDFRSDPADEIIAATSIVHSAPLLTRDARLRASSLVPLAIR